MIGGHLSIPDNTIVAGATTVLSTIKVPGMYNGSFPQMTHREWTYAASHVRRLRALADRVAELERALRAQARRQGGIPMTLIELEALVQGPSPPLSRHCWSTGSSSACPGSPRAA